MRRWSLLPALLMVLWIAACGSDTDTAVVESVEPATAAAALEDGAILLDIRTPEEFAEARITGARNIDYYASDFAARLGELDREATYVIYCRSGNRTTAALDIFRDLGFTSVQAVDGGILAWAGLGYAVEQG
jgi:phage shock protein E